MCDTLIKFEVYMLQQNEIEIDSTTEELPSSVKKPKLDAKGKKNEAAQLQERKKFFFVKSGSCKVKGKGDI